MLIRRILSSDHAWPLLLCAKRSSRPIGPTSFTRHGWIRVSSIVQYSSLLPPVGVYRVSAPVWLVILSDQLEIVGLVGLYPTNYLIPLGLILWQVARKSHPFVSRHYAVLATVSRRYPPP